MREFVGSPLDLVADLGSCRDLLIIDSMASGTLKRGEVALFSEEEILQSAKTFYLHGMNLAEALATAKRMGVAVPRVNLIGIEVGEIQEFGDAPDPELTDKIEEIYRRVLEMARRWYSGREERGNHV